MLCLSFSEIRDQDLSVTNNSISFLLGPSVRRLEYFLHFDQTFIEILYFCAS